jgi:hypothetical protein
MWLPDWLYKTLPFIYALMGGLAVYHGANLVGRASGVLLILTAFLIWLLRKGQGSTTRSRRS